MATANAKPAGRQIVLPNNWAPRDYQLPAWKALESGIKRAMLIWHRRAGKDDLCLHWAACAAMQRVGNYWHMLPQYSQARKSVWEAVNPRTGKRRIDEAFPDEICEVKRGTDMFIRFKNGSTWQLVGSDSYDALVGSPPIGVTASEWALARPAAWAYLRPILKENGGWAMFITTPRGKNHAHRMFYAAKDDPEWFCQRLTAEDTKTLTAEDLHKERAEYMREYGADDGDALFRQEYLCDFTAALVGAYYGRQMAEAEKDGRICAVPYDAGHLVHTAWDLGLSDMTAIWMFQIVGREIHVIDYLENSGQMLAWYASELAKKPYQWGTDILPHDGGAGELQTAKTRAQALKELGRNPLVLENGGPERVQVADGINMVRNLLSRCLFDSKKCSQGIEALGSYRRKWDEERKVYVDRPEHDWASHPADAMRYLAVGLDRIPGSRVTAKVKRLRPATSWRVL